MSKANIPMSNTLSWQVSAVYSAILLGPHHAQCLPDPEPFSLSAPLTADTHCVTQFRKVFNRMLSWKDTKMPLLPVAICYFTVMAYDKQGDNIIPSCRWQP